MQASQTSASALPQLLGGAMVVLVLLARPEGLSSFMRRPARAVVPTPEREVVITRLSGRTDHARLRRVIAATNGHHPVPALVLDKGESR